MITDIMDIYPLTIVEKFVNNERRYYAFNEFQQNVPALSEYARFIDADGEYSYISLFDKWITTNNIVFGYSDTIKGACKDLVIKLNKNERR